MGRKALLAVICWLTLSEARGDPAKTVNSSLIKDNESEQSAPRLYHSVPVGVYASRAPYGTFSIHSAALTGPHVAASKLAPVVAKTVIHDTNQYLKNLKDSYGKFVQAPQTAAYKSAFPQQYVQLQALPAHLSQPLVAASPSFQYKQAAPHFYFGSQHYRVPSLQQATPTPITRFGGFSQPLVYAENIRGFAPSSGFFTRVNGFPTQQQSTSNRATYTSSPGHQQERPQLQSENKSNPKQQTNNSENGQIQAAPAQTSVTAIVNGKKTIITLDTNPVVPLLDLSLLEPLTFANPVVPQVQHFLPKIQPTFKVLPPPDDDDDEDDDDDNDLKNRQKEIFIQMTKSYGSEHINGKPKNESPKNKHNDSPRPQNPTITIIKGDPNGSPEISYEISGPNFKETYNEQVVKYNKETKMLPVEYSYSEQSTTKPMSYSFTRSSNEPLQIKHVEYESDPEEPKQLIYKFSPEEQHEELRGSPAPAESEDSGESDESDDDDDPQHHGDHEDLKDSPKHPQHSQNHHEYPNQHQGHYEDRRVHEGLPNHSEKHSDLREHHKESPKHSDYYTGHHKESPKHFYQRNDHIGHREEPSRQTQHNANHYKHHGESPRQSHHLKAEHREQEHHNRPSQELRHEEPHYYSEPLTVTVQNLEFEPITPEYEEEIRILPTHKPHASIKVDPNQHVQLGPSTQHGGIHSTASPQKHPQVQHQNDHQEHPIHSRPHSSPVPHIYETSKRVIIKENEESPGELHMHAEQMMEQMREQEENNEEDFEKAYKESAFGFPAYEQHQDAEKDIYNPESYGAPRYHNEYNIENTPLQKYQVKGDEFPQASRANYKDARDQTKENYFLEYSVKKPESFNDRYRKKEDYYKTYSKNRPEKLFDHDDEKSKQKHKEKYIAAPSFVFQTPVSRPKQKYFARYKAVPKKYEYNYAKEAPHDNNAYASGPYHKYKTHFVEPQFQYGFEPVLAPLSIDSELAAMASNNSPESEKPGTRKKIYKENWYIKKTRTTAGEPS